VLNYVMAQVISDVSLMAMLLNMQLSGFQDLFLLFASIA
jgi:hypothetical protein